MSTDHLADFSAAPGGTPAEVIGQILQAWATEVGFVEIVVSEVLSGVPVDEREAAVRCPCLLLNGS